MTKLSATLILCLLATPAGAQSTPTPPMTLYMTQECHGGRPNVIGDLSLECTNYHPPPDDLQKAADICARHIATGGEFETGWADDCAAVNVEIVRRAEAARREAEKPDRDFVEKIAKGLKP